MSKAKQGLKRFGETLRAAIFFIWHRPIIISAVLLVAAYFLFNVITKQTFKPYTNCDYLIGTFLSLPKEKDVLCDGFDLGWFGHIPGLRGAMDGPLEFLRSVTAWTIVIFFAFLSTFLTIIINRFTSIVKILTLNKEEWRHFMATIRIWLLLFVIFGSIFYLNVIR